MSLVLPYPLPASGVPQAAYVQADLDTIVSAVNNGTGLVTSITGTANQVIASASTGAITLSLPQNIDAAATPTFASETLTATSNQLVLGTTRTVTITAPTPASSSRSWTIPDISGNGTFAALEGTQTFSGTKTFSSGVAITATSSHIALSTSSNKAIVQASAQATSDRTFSIPDISGNGTFAFLEGTQTFSGSKTFSNSIVVGGNTTGDSNYGTIGSVSFGKYYQGTFTASFTGAFSSSQTITYTLVGRIVTLYVPAFTATATSADHLTASAAIPSNLRPGHQIDFDCATVKDNGTVQTTPGRVIADSDGTIYIFKNAVNDFTGSGSTGLQNACSITYQVGI